MAASTMQSLAEDEVEDLLYLARANETDELKQFIAELAQKYSVHQAQIPAAAIDAESGNGALHFAAANGHIGEMIVTLPASYNLTRAL